MNLKEAIGLAEGEHFKNLAKMALEDGLNGESLFALEVSRTASALAMLKETEIQNRLLEQIVQGLKAK